MKYLISVFTAIDKNRIIHSLKTAIACLIGFFISKFFNLHTNQWVLITIIVVMCAQSRVGALLQKSYMRLAGTFIGAIITIGVLIIYGTDPLAILLTVCLSAAFFSYIAEGSSLISEAGTIGAVTVAIVLLGQEPTFSVVFLRLIEILLGMVIAFLVSRFLWPVHAKKRLFYSIVNTLHHLKKLYSAIEPINNQEDSAVVEQREEQIIAAMLLQRKLFEEAIKESFNSNVFIREFKTILRGERELLRSISLMHHASHSLSFAKLTAFYHLSELKLFHQQIEEAFIKLIEHVEKNKIQGNELPSLVNLQTDWQKVLKGKMVSVSDDILEEDILHIDTFIFAAKRLIQQLNLLMKIMQKIEN